MGQTFPDLISFDLFQLFCVCVSEGQLDILKPFSLYGHPFYLIFIKS